MASRARDLGRRAALVQKKAIREAEIPALLGKLRADGSVSLRGDSANGDLLPTNQVYVRLHGLDGDTPRVAWCTAVSLKANNGVYVKENHDKTLSVVRLWDKRATEFLGEQAADTALPLSTGLWPGLVSIRNYSEFRPEGSALGGLYIHIRPGWLNGVWGEFGDVDLSTYQTTTPDSKAWIVGAIDDTTTPPSLVWDVGDDKPLTYTKVREDIETVLADTALAGKLPLVAVLLSDTATTWSDADPSAFEDLRDWYSRGGDSGGGTVTDVTASAPLASSGGATPDISLSSAVPLELGGTESDLSATGPGTLVQASNGAAVTTRLDMLAGTTAPTANDDSGDGYSVGSRWYDTTNDKEYVCLDASSGAAVWKETTVSPTGGTVDIEDDGSAEGAADTIDFTGAGVSVTFAAGKATVNIPGGGGGGGIDTETAAYASLTTGNDGDLRFPTDSPYLFRSNGSALVPWGPLFPMTLPPTSGWSWVNQGSATLDSSKGPLYLYTPSSGGSTNLRCYVRTAPATPYVITAYLEPTMPVIANDVGYGLMWRQSSDGKLVRVGLDGYTPSFVAQSWSSVTAFNGTYFSATVIEMPRWFRIADDGTNRIISVSGDGQHWHQIHSGSRTDYLTADQVGFWVSARATNINMGVTLLSWAEG